MLVSKSLDSSSFGYDTGQISSFLAMKHFEESFADQRNPLAFGDGRSRLTVIDTLVGALVAAPSAEARFLRREYSICIWCIIFCVGIIVQITVL